MATNTVNTIFTANNGNYDLCALQLGPDGKIYMARDNKNFISVINNPDVIGTGCNFVSNGFTLFAGTTSAAGLPTFHQSSLNFHANSFTYSQNACSSYDFIAHSTSLDSLVWNFNDPSTGNNNFSNIINPSHTFSNTGNYDVTLLVYNSCYTDTLHQLINVTANNIQVNLGNDTTLCSGASFTINAGNSFSSYSWNTGAISQAINVTNSGVYSITVTDNSGCSGTDSVNIIFSPQLSINLGNDTSVCIGNQVTFNAGSGYTNYLWNNGSTTSSITASNSGIYSVTVTSNSGCSGVDSVQLVVGNNILFSIGNDTSFCNGNQILLNAGSGYASYSWSTGSANSSINVADSGYYSITVTDNSGCFGADSIHISIEPSPTVFIGNDTVLCQGSSLFLDAENTGATYLWSNFSTNQSISVSASGLYWVIVTTNNCTSSDSIVIRLAPAIDLGRDISLCHQAEVTLSSNIFADSYLWSTGNTNPFIVLTEPGMYWLTAQVENCTLTDTINVTGGETSLYIPNAFTPDNDGINEVFTPIGQGITEYHFMVFNRWGQMLFESKDINKGWDGKFKENLCQTGLYTWVLEYGTICEGERYWRKYGLVMLLK